MPTLDIQVAGRSHTVQCDDGEETRLKRLAAYLDEKARELAQRQPQLTESRILLLGGLLIVDELFDAYDEIRRLRSNAQAGDGPAVASGDHEALDRIAQRLEELAEALEAH